MSGGYPQFKPSHSHEELVEHFLVTPADLQLALTCRGQANRRDVDSLCVLCDRAYMIFDDLFVERIHT